MSTESLFSPKKSFGASPVERSSNDPQQSQPNTFYFGTPLMWVLKVISGGNIPAFGGDFIFFDGITSNP